MQIQERPKQRSTVIQKYGWIVLIVCLVTAMVGYIIRNQHHFHQSMSVKTVTIRTGKVTQQIFSTGTVVSAHSRNLLPPSGMRGTPNIKVFIGQHVKKGQTLVTYPTDDLQRKVDSDQTVVHAQKIILDGAKQLIHNANKSGTSHKSPSYIQLEQSVQEDQIQFKNAESQLNQDKQTLKDADIRSPFTGTVISVKTADKTSQQGSGSLVQIADLHDLKINASLSQANASLISKGKHVVIKASAFPGKSWDGKVEMVAPTATSKGNGGSTNVNITVSTPKNFPIHPGFNVNLIIDAKSGSGLIIPYSALVENGNGSEVWIVKRGKVQLGKVQLGVTGNKVAEVTTGLHEGAKVVVNPPQSLFSGEDVSSK